MNILHIVRGKKGGTSEYLKLLYKYSDKKFNNIILCNDEIFEEFSGLGFNVINLDMPREISLKKDFKNIFKIVKYIKKEKIDLVYCHSSKPGAIGRIACKITHTHNIYNPHGWAFNMKVSKKKQKIYELIEKFFAFFSDKIIMISKSEYYSALSKKICNEKKLVLINNGVDVSKFTRMKNETILNKLDIPKDFKIIGMCARLEEQKNPIAFIEIAKKVISQYPKCKFILIGDGSLKINVISKIQDLHLQGKVILTGWVSNPEEYISILDVGVLTSKWEGFGLSLAEYMASGEPVVASDVDGIPYVIKNNVDGFLCNPNNIDEFANKIIELLNNEELYNKFSKSAYRDVCDKFNSKRVIEQHEQLYSSVINS